MKKVRNKKQEAGSTKQDARSRKHESCLLLHVSCFVLVLILQISCSQLSAMEWFPKGGEPKAEEMTDTSKMAEFGEKTDYKVLPEECLYGQVSGDGKCVDCKSDEECVNQYPESRYPGATGTCNETKQRDGTVIRRCGCPLINAGLMCGSGLVCDENERYCRMCTNDDECLIAYGSENFCDKRSGGQGYCVGKDATTGVSQQFGVHLPCDEMDKIKDPRYKKYVAEECKKLYAGLPKANPSQLPSMGRPSVLLPPQYQAPKPKEIWGLRNAISPADVAVDYKGTIYVADYDEGYEGKIQMLSSDGKLLGSFSCEDSSNSKCFPKLITVGYKNNSHAGDIFVVSQKNEIRIFSLTNKNFIRSFNVSGNVQDIEVFNDKIYLSDASGGVILVYDSFGKTINTIGKKGNSDGELNNPSFLAIDHKKNQLYVVDEQQPSGKSIILERIQVFDLTTGKYIKKYESDKYDYDGIAFYDKKNYLYVSTLGFDLYTSKYHSLLMSNGRSRGLYDDLDVHNIILDELVGTYTGLTVWGTRLIFIITECSSVVSVDFDNPLYLTITSSTCGPFGQKILNGWIYGRCGKDNSPYWDWLNKKCILPFQKLHRPSGKGEIGFFNPRGVKFAGNAVYVADYYSNRIVALDAINGSFIREWLDVNASTALNQNRDTKYHDFAGLAIGLNYVCAVDKKLSTVICYDMLGNSKFSFGSHGVLDGEFLSPEDIAIDSQGFFYVVDSRRHIVNVFSPSGKYLTKIGGVGNKDGEFSMPSAITKDLNGNIAILDCGNSRIQFFKPDYASQPPKYKFFTKIQISQVSSPNECYFNGIAMNSEGLVLITNSLLDRVEVYGPNGQIVYTLGGPEKSLLKTPGEFHNPYGITIDGYDNVYVTDDSNVHVFKQ